MANTTIQISDEMKQNLSSFGMKGDTYEDILRRIYDVAIKQQLREFLLSSENTISLENAKERHNKKWLK